MRPAKLACLAFNRFRYEAITVTITVSNSNTAELEGILACITIGGEIEVNRQLKLVTMINSRIIKLITTVPSYQSTLSLNKLERENIYERYEALVRSLTQRKADSVKKYILKYMYRQRGESDATGRGQRFQIYKFFCH